MDDWMKTLPLSDKHRANIRGASSAVFPSLSSGSATSSTCPSSLHRRNYPDKCSNSNNIIISSKSDHIRCSGATTGSGKIGADPVPEAIAKFRQQIQAQKEAQQRPLSKFLTQKNFASTNESTQISTSRPRQFHAGGLQDSYGDNSFEKDMKSLQEISTICDEFDIDTDDESIENDIDCETDDSDKSDDDSESELDVDINGEISDNGLDISDNGPENEFDKRVKRGGTSTATDNFGFPIFPWNTVKEGRGVATVVAATAKEIEKAAQDLLLRKASSATRRTRLASMSNHPSRAPSNRTDSLATKTTFSGQVAPLKSMNDDYKSKSSRSASLPELLHMKRNDNDEAKSNSKQNERTTGRTRVSKDTNPSHRSASLTFLDEKEENNQKAQKVKKTTTMASFPTASTTTGRSANLATLDEKRRKPSSSSIGVMTGILRSPTQQKIKDVSCLKKESSRQAKKTKTSSSQRSSSVTALDAVESGRMSKEKRNAEEKARSSDVVCSENEEMPTLNNQRSHTLTEVDDKKKISRSPRPSGTSEKASRKTHYSSSATDEVETSWDPILMQNQIWSEPCSSRPSSSSTSCHQSIRLENQNIDQKDDGSDSRIEKKNNASELPSSYSFCGVTDLDSELSTSSNQQKSKKEQPCEKQPQQRRFHSVPDLAEKKSTRTKLISSSAIDDPASTKHSSDSARRKSKSRQEHISTYHRSRSPSLSPSTRHTRPLHGAQSQHCEDRVSTRHSDGMNGDSRDSEDPKENGLIVDLDLGSNRKARSPKRNLSPKSCSSLPARIKDDPRTPSKSKQSIEKYPMTPPSATSRTSTATVTSCSTLSSKSCDKSSNSNHFPSAAKKSQSTFSSAIPFDHEEHKLPPAPPLGSPKKITLITSPSPRRSYRKSTSRSAPYKPGQKSCS